MFTRIDLCALTAVDTEQFKSLWHRRQLPLRQTGNARARRAEAYSPLDVLTIAVGEVLGAEIGRERGLPTSVAMMMAGRAREWISMAFGQQGGPDLWAGCVASRVGRAERNGTVKTIWCTGGTLSAVIADIDRESARNDCAAVRVFLVNISEVIREVRERARAAHIYFPADDREAA